MRLKDYLSENLIVSKSILDIETQISEAIDVCCSALRSGNTLFFCGNGGSAADAQHFAAEFLGRFLIDRMPLSAIALTVDTSALTAIGNDYGYDKVFSRQLQGLGKKGDVLFGLSTSGNSKNVVNAFHVAKDLNIKTISMTGSDACDLDSLSDVTLKANSSKTNFIQESHFVMGHYICLRVEELLCKINL
jgi:D-sedoheptulose 7-phosphate isomerase